MSDLAEWRDDVRRMTEVERQIALDAPWQALGMTGDEEDAIYE